MPLIRRRVITEPGSRNTARGRILATQAWSDCSWTDPGSSSSCTDEVHKLPIDTTSNTGGPLQIVKSKSAFTHGYISNTLWDGAIGVGDPSSPGTYAAHDIGKVKSDSELGSLGTTAIARCEPTSPVFDAATFIGELREGGLRAPGIEAIHSLRARTQLAKAAGSEYLNVEFGWKPLLSDLRKLHYAAHESERIMKAYRKGSDHKIRQAYSFPPEVETRLYKGSFFPSNTTFNHFFSGTQVSQMQSRTWFSGAFRYHLPTNDDQMNKFTDYRQKASKLYGLRLTPEVVWNLAPWSWAIDWFSNTGDVLHNISAMGHDGLAMQYGYVMFQKETTVTTVANTSFSVNYKPYFTSASAYRYNCIKQRLPATPYGFGVDLSKLSPKQTAILVALGLSR